MRRLLPGQYGGGSAYCAPGGGTIRLRNAPYLALRAQYGLWGAAISLYELNTPAAPPIVPPEGAQYGYAMRPISPYGLNTGSGARLFRSTSSIRRALNLPILTTQVLKSLQLHI